MGATLLVELLTEELPPKSLARLGQAFADFLVSDLRNDNFLSTDSELRWFATPRRLAVSVSRVLEKAPDQPDEQKGPSLKVGLDASGKPTMALLKFAEKNGVSVDSLVQVQTQKGVVFACRKMAKGAYLDATLWLKVEDALKRLPVAKTMRWGAGEAQFVRPVHGLVMPHGAREVRCTGLGVSASSTTRGHRFMAVGPIALENADEYEARLRDDGMVIADFAARRAEIERQLRAQAERLGASLGEFAELLDEVTALVEHPSVYVGGFDSSFLEVPQECLILTMRQNQKYFPLFDASDRLLPGAARPGPRALTFAPLLVHDVAPLNAVVRRLLADSERALGEQVEIEFAVTFPDDGGCRLGFLQVRPLVVSQEFLSLGPADLRAEGLLVASHAVLGNGAVTEIRDIVYVRP